MATLLHFLRPLAVSLVAGFLLSLGGLGLLLIGFMLLAMSPLAAMSDPCYVQLSRFLAAFGGGDRIEGMVAISLAIGFVIALLSSFSSYKRIQRDEWHLASTRD